MTRRLFLIGGVLSVALWLVLSPTLEKKPANQIVRLSDVELIVKDYTNTFDHFWLTSKSLSKAKALEQFNETVYPAFPEFYRSLFYQWQTHGKSPEDQLAKEMDVYPSYRKNFLLIAQELPKYLKTSLTSFLELFPDFNGSLTVHIVQSFNEMDGGTRIFGDRVYLIFGAESIAKFHSSQSFERKIPFLHHELFHMYHRKFFHEKNTLLDGLWCEGLAVLVAETLNPKADFAQLSLDNPKDLMKNCRKLQKRLADDLQHHLKNPTQEDYSIYFYANSKHEWIPRRAGYCLGYWLAKSAHRGRTLQELVRFQRDEIQTELNAVLPEWQKGQF